MRDCLGPFALREITGCNLNRQRHNRLSAVFAIATVSTEMNDHNVSITVDAENQQISGIIHAGKQNSRTESPIGTNPRMLMAQSRSENPRLSAG